MFRWRKENDCKEMKYLINLWRGNVFHIQYINLSLQTNGNVIFSSVTIFSFSFFLSAVVYFWFCAYIPSAFEISVIFFAVVFSTSIYELDGNTFSTKVLLRLLSHPNRNGSRFRHWFHWILGFDKYSIPSNSKIDSLRRNHDSNMKILFWNTIFSLGYNTLAISFVKCVCAFCLQ